MRAQGAYRASGVGTGIRPGTVGKSPEPQLCRSVVGLRRRPVRGSVVLRERQGQPTPLAAWASFLPVRLESARSARDWTAIFLEHVGSANPLPGHDDALLVVSELVANAVKAMAVAMASGSFVGPAFAELSLRLFPAHLLIEVIDSSPEIPVAKLEADPEALDRRGLALVDAVSERWGWNWHMGRSRKIVWCKLAALADETPTRTPEQ